MIPHFLTKLEDSISKLHSKHIAIICGDTNINILNQDHADTSEYFTTLSFHNFLPHILTPTRITHHSATCIDHIFLRLPSKKIDCEVFAGNIIAEIADHLPNFLMIQDPQNSTKSPRPYIRIFGEKNITRFKHYLDITDWEALLQSADINSASNAFYSHIIGLYDNCFPYVRQSRQRAKDKKWMTQGLINSTKQKDSLYKKQLSNPSEENIEKYKKHRNKLNSLLDQAEKKYYDKKLSDKKNGIQNFWKSFGPILNPSKTKTHSHIPRLLIENTEVTGDQNIADAMNDYFCNVGEKINRKIPNVHGHFSNYLKNKIKDTFFLSALTEVETYRELSKLNETKSSGPDNIKPKLAKICKDQFVKPLTILYNKAIETATYPSEFKQAKVIALYKKQSRFIPSNYRPISLLNCFNKIFESLIYNQMIKFIDKHKILYINQYGYRAGFSTTLALIDVVDTIKMAVNRNEYAMGIFLDLEKAFDTINHEILLAKLDHYGFRGHVNIFINSYLNERKQYASVNKKESNYQRINFGVPQGSILGPLFFIIYINDISSAITNFAGKLYADDTALILHHKNINILVNNAELALSNVSHWFKINKLSVSHGKSTFILFHDRRKSSCPELNSLHVDNNYIPRSNEVKYIGLTLDENLNWDSHLKELRNSLTKYFSVFYHIRNFLNKRLVRTIYYSCIYSRIASSIEIYGACGATKLDKIQTLQNKLMKLLTKRDIQYSTNDLHTELNILKVTDIHRYKTLQFVYNCLTGNQISNFSNYFTIKEHQFNLRNTKQLHTPKIRTEHGRSTVQHTGATLWNNLPEHIISSKSIHIFKRRLFAQTISEYRR